MRSGPEKSGSGKNRFSGESYHTIHSTHAAAFGSTGNSDPFAPGCQFTSYEPLPIVESGLPVDHDWITLPLSAERRKLPHARQA